MMTIGHATLPIEVFVHILRQNDVRILVDVRTIPASRHNPQFAQPTLAESLDEAGIRYRWHKSLGGLRQPTKESPNTGWLNSSFRGYADYMQTRQFSEAIEGLLEVKPYSHTAIMCAEVVPWRCHRSLIADALTVRGIPVEHIYYDSSLKQVSGVEPVFRRLPHRLTSFAKVRDLRIWYPAAQDDLFKNVPPVRRIS